MTNTWGEILADALREIGVYNPNDDLEADDLTQGARRLQRIIDMWIARRIFAYGTVFNKFTLTSGHQPTLLGPGLTSPDFAYDVRPVRLESAAIVLTNTGTPVDSPMNLRDAAWWAEETTKEITSSVPTDCYYKTGWPNGALFIWPVPSFAYDIRLQTWILLTQVPMTDAGAIDVSATFSAPPGYELATMLTLAEHSCTPYGRPMPMDLKERAAEARSVVYANNAKSPRIASADYGAQGHPASATTRGDFNWLDGLPSE
jgi:hypothetical protein